MRAVYTSVLAGSLLLTAVPASRADLPVVDVAQLKAWATQAQQMANTITQLEAQLRAITDIPQDLIQQVQGLLNSAVSNPLGQITQNLGTLLRGTGPGSCGNAQTYLTTNTYSAPVGTDFTAQSMQQQMNRAAGLQACTQQLMTATQTTLADLPALLTQLQGATDVTQATAISGRIQVEIATINAQQQQAQLLASSGLLQAQMTQMQIDEKQRSDAQELFNATSPGAAAGTVPAVTPAPNLFVGG